MSVTIEVQDNQHQVDKQDKNIKKFRFFLMGGGNWMTFPTNLCRNYKEFSSIQTNIDSVIIRQTIST